MTGGPAPNILGRIVRKHEEEGSAHANKDSVVVVVGDVLDELVPAEFLNEDGHENGGRAYHPR